MTSSVVVQPWNVRMSCTTRYTTVKPYKWLNPLNPPSLYLLEPLDELHAGSRVGCEPRLLSTHGSVAHL